MSSGLTYSSAEFYGKGWSLGNLEMLSRFYEKYPDYADLYTILSRAVLAEFLPAAERMSLSNIFEELGIQQLTPPVCDLM